MAQKTETGHIGCRMDRILSADLASVFVQRCHGRNGTTAAGQRNRNHTGPYVTFENVPFAMEEVLFDPQTSGGLLLAVLPEEANALEAELQAAGLPAKIVGEIIPKTEQEITVKY